MSIVAELLKSNAVKASQLVLNQQATLKLGIGDLLKLPEGEGVQTLRQGQDLVVLIDAGDGSPPERVVVQGFFAAGSLGMVQIGPDGNAEMVTPRSVVATLNASPSTPSTPAAAAQSEASEATASTTSVFPNQLLQELAVSDTSGVAVTDQASPTPVAVAGLAQLLDSVADSAPLQALPDVVDRSLQSITAANLYVAPALAPLANGVWINAQNLRTGADFQGEGADGCVVELSFVSARASFTHSVTVQGGQWAFTLSGAEISQLGEGALSLSARQLSGLGQVASATVVVPLAIDTIPPLVPVVSSPLALRDGLLNADDATSSPLTFTVRGEPGSVVTLTLADAPAHTASVSATVNAQGLCQLDIRALLTGLSDGQVLYTVRSVDAAGNVSTAQDQPGFALHQALPGAPVARLLEDDDHGALNSDGVTNVTTPGFVGQVASDVVSVRVYRDLVDASGSADGLASANELLTTITPNADGTFSFRSTDLGANAGAQHFLFVGVDAYGNRSATTAVNLVIDNTVNPPALDPVTVDNALSYAETLASSIRISGTGEALAQISVTLSANGRTHTYDGIQVGADEKWFADIFSNVVGDGSDKSLRYGFGENFNGYIDIVVRQTDLAGNGPIAAETSRIYVRTTPIPQIDSLIFGADADGVSDDKGFSQTDGVTNLSSFHVQGVGPASDPGEGNMEVWIYNDKNGNGAVDTGDAFIAKLTTDAGGSFSGLLPTLADGEYRLISVVHDRLSGSTSPSSGITASLSVVVDTQVGNVTFDDIVSNRNIVTLHDLESGYVTVSGQGEPQARVNLIFNAGTVELSSYTDIQVNANGRWSVSVAAADILAFGSTSVTLRATQKDLAGNATDKNSSVEKVFDVKLGILDTPTAITLLAADDTGVSSSDGITYKNLGVTITGESQPGYVVTVFRDANRDGVLQANEVLGTATAGPDGHFGVLVNLPEGSNQIRALATDDFGQTSGVTAAYTVVVDKTIAAPASLQVTQDNIINAQEASTDSASFSGLAKSQATVKLDFYSGNTLVLTQSTQADVDGAWQIELTQAEIEQLQNAANGASVAPNAFAGGNAGWIVKAQQTDLAGNVSTYAQQSFVIDTVAPLVDDANNVDAARAFNEDAARPWRSVAGDDQLMWSELYGFTAGIAQPRTLQVAVGLLADVELNDTVRMTWGTKTVSHQVRAEDLARGYALVDIGGDLIERNRSETGQNSAHVTATFVDVAGNESSSVEVITSVNVTLAGAPPIMTPTLDSYGVYDSADSTYYSRNSSANNEAGRQTFTLVGQAAAGDQILVFNDKDSGRDGIVQDGEALGTFTADSLGNFTATLSLLPGQYHLRAISIVTEGASPTNVQSVLIDITPPNAPTLSSNVISVDNRVGASERDAGVVLTGTGEAFAQVNVQLKNLSTGVVGDINRSVTVRADGTWSVTIGLVQWGQVGDGTVQVLVSQTDRGGNTSPVYTIAGSAPQVQFDTVVATPVIYAVADDNIINAAESNGQVVVRGGGEPGATMTLTFTGSNGTVGPNNVTVDANGVWTYTLLSSQIGTRLGNGQVAIKAVQTDLAGNVSAEATRVMLVDTLVFAPQIAAVTGDDIVNAGERSLGVPVSGTAEPGATLSVSISGRSGQVRTISSVVADQAGDWRVIFPATDIDDMGQGLCTVTVNQVDLAGNSTLTNAPPNPGTRTFQIATGPLTEVVVVSPVTGDNQVLVGEQQQGISVQGTAPRNTTLHLSLIGVRSTLDFTLTVGDSGTWSIPLGTAQLQNTLGAGTVQIRAYADNVQQQSTSLLTQTFTIELQEPSASISRVANDNYINALEAAGSITLDGGGVAGHLVDVTITRGQVTLPFNSVLVGDDRKWNVTLSAGDMALLGDGTVTIHTVQRDPSNANAQPSITVSSTFVIDTTAPAVPNDSDTTASNVYNSTQSAMAGGVTVAEARNGVVVAVALPADAVAGDRFTVNWGDVQVTQVITAAMVPLQGARVANVTIPTGTLIAQGDGVFDVSVVFTDIAGNSSAPRILASSLSVLAPPAPPSFNAVYADNYINATEFQAIAAGAKGQITGNAADGGVVNLTLTGPGGVQAVFNALPVAGGTWTALFTPEQLIALGEGRISASAVYVSASGAVSSASVADIVFDRTAPLAPATTSDNFIAAADANARNELAGGLIRNGNTVTEAASSATVNVPLAVDVVSGDVVTLYWGDKQQVNAIVTQADISRGYVPVVVSSFVMSMEGDNDALQAQASVTDKAGNVGAKYLVWTGKVDAIPVTPEVDNIESNNYVNIAKAAAGWHVTGRGVAHATVVVTITGTKLGGDGNPVTIVTSELPVTENAEGVYTWGVNLTAAQAQQLGDGRIKITSVQYDENRNPSDPGKNPSDPSIRYFYIDTLKPTKPVIDNVTADNRVSFAEGQSDITISGTGESDATLSISISHAGKSYNKTATVVNGVWSVVLATSELQALGGGSEPIALVAMQTDAAGNVSDAGTKSFLYTTDAVNPPTFTSVTGVVPLTDTAFNAADLALTAQVPFTVSGRAQYDAATPYTVRLTALVNKTSSYSWVLEVDSNGNWTKAFTDLELATLNQRFQNQILLSAVQIAKTGDESVETVFATQTVENTFLLDFKLPVLVNTAVAVVDPQGLIKANAKAGDVVTVTVQASENLQWANLDPLNRPTIQLDLGNGQTRNAVYDAVRSQTAGSDKLVFTYTVVNGDNGVSITPAATLQLYGATLLDEAFNPAANSIGSTPLVTVRVDTTPPAVPTILPVDAVGASSPGSMLEGGVLVNKINVGEANGGVKVRVDLNVGVGGSRPLVGDSVELAWTVGTNTVKLSKQITSQDLDATHGYIDITVPTNVVGSIEGSATLQATLVDLAGNRSAASANVVVLVDTVAPATMDFDLWMEDNKINLLESLNGGAALTAITGTGLEAGAVVSVSLQQGSVNVGVTVVPGTAPGTWAISKQNMQNALAALADGSFTVTVSQTDAAGNRGLSRTASYYIDRGVPGKPTITGVPQNEDGWINLRDAQTVGVTVAVTLTGTGAVAGDTLVVGGFTADARYTLTAADITANQVIVAMPAAAVLQNALEGPAVGRVLNARIEDQGGNVSPASANFSVNVDTNIASPIVDTTQGAAKGVSKNQAKAAVDFFGGGVELGAQVSVYFTGVLGSTLLSTSTGDSSGNFKVTLQPNDLASLGDGPVSYRVVQTDKALNTSADTLGSFDLRLSTPLPTLLNMTEDNVVSADEAKALSTEYKGLGVPGDLVVVNFYVRDPISGLYQTTPAIAAKTATVDASGNWKVQLSATDFTNLSLQGQGTVQVLATQTEDDSTSGNADLEFYIDRQAPTLAASPNLLTYTQAIDYSSWGKTGGVVKANQIANPLDGAVNAEAIIVNKATNAVVNEAVSQTFAVTAGQTYTVSMYVKNGTANLPWLEMTTSGDSTRRQWFNLADGSIGATNGTIGSKSIAAVGDGWYRASFTFTATATATDTFWFSTRSGNNNSGTGALTSDGVSPAMYAYGTQIEVAPSDTTYKTVSALPSLTLFDGNGDGANNDGLLVTFSEPVAVNNLLNVTAYTPTSGRTMGSDFKVQAVDSRSINGQFYATQFKLFLDTDSTMVQGSTITIARTSIVDAGGNLAGAAQVLTIPNISVPGLPTPPVDIMSDNRINRDEASNVTRLTYSDTNTAAQLNAALGGLMQTYVNGVLADEVIPKANFLSMTLTFNKAAKLLQGQASAANVRVTFRDGGIQDITLYTTGTLDTQATATTKYTYTSKQILDLANISNITYLNANLGYGFAVPMTVDPTGTNPSSGLKVASTTTNGVSQTTATVTLDFPNTMKLASGATSNAQIYLYFTDLNRWEIVNASSPVGTATTAGGFTSMTYTYTSNRPVRTNNNFYWDTVPSNLSLDSGISVVTTGTNAPVILAQYDTSVVIPTSSYSPNATLTTNLLDKNLAALSGTLDTFTAGTTTVPGQKFVASNPNRILYSQSLTDALNAAGRKLQMFVDGVPAGTGTTMGIDVVNLYLKADWENQYGGNAGWGAGQSLQAGSTVTARITVTFKTVAGVTPAPVDVLLTAVGNQSPTGNYPLQFTGDFVDAATGLKIDPTTVANMGYKPGSISQVFPNEVVWQSGITTSQYVDLPASAWAGQTDGLKQLTAQITTTDGTLTSVYSAPKQIRLDQAVGSITSVALDTDANNNGTLDAGDTLQLRFSEPVSFTFSALPASFGTNAQVTPIGAENGFSQFWTVKLGTGATVVPGQTMLKLEARKVFDQAGNDNGTGPETAILIPDTIMARAGTPIIDNVSTDNVVESGTDVTAVKVNLTKAKVGDVVKLFMDGVQLGNGQTVGVDGQANVTFNLGGEGNTSWGGDGERRLTTTITRGSDTVSSAPRSVYVATEVAHWSQEKAYAGRINWFNPDAIVQADGTKVTTWVASAGGLTVANTVNNSATIKITDAITGHVQLVMDGSSVFYETKVNGVYQYQLVAPQMLKYVNSTPDTGVVYGFTDFTMFKPTVSGGQTLLAHPIKTYTSNSTAISYTPLGQTTVVNVAANTPYMRSVSTSYSFSTDSNVNFQEWPRWNNNMTNVISLGSWQMVSESIVNNTAYMYNQMRFNAAFAYGNWTPSANDPLTNYNVTPGSAASLFRIGGGIGLVGDQIDITASTGLAYQQEIGAYLAAKFQSTGSVWGRNADPLNTTYDLTLSNVPGTLIDQNLALNDAVSNDTVRTAGADYVVTGAGNDVIGINDLTYRYLDGGSGYDTLKLDHKFIGNSTFNLSDYASNFRGLSGLTAADNSRVNDAGYHRLLGFEKIDTVQDTDTTNLRQVMTVSAADVVALSDTRRLEFALGKEDVLKTKGFTTDYGTVGIWNINGNWYDHYYTGNVVNNLTGTAVSQKAELYSSGGDRVPEAVSFKTVSALNQVQITFDHAMLGTVLAGDFQITTYTGPSLYATSALSVNLRQGVSLTLSGPLNYVSKITYNNGNIADEAGRSFMHNVWMLGTNGADTLNGASLSSAEQAKGVTFMSGNGNDTIVGTSGSDLIIGGLGADVLTGGRGSDTFYYRNEITGSGSAGGLGGTSGDVITDFTWNDSDPSQNDRIDLSALFENFTPGLNGGLPTGPTGNAAIDAANLINGGFLDVRKVTNFQTGKQDLQLWVDRDGGGLYGELATIANGGSNLPQTMFNGVPEYPAEEPAKDFLTRLLAEGRIVVSHF